MDKQKVITAQMVIFNCIMEGEHADPEKCDVSPGEFIEIVSEMDDKNYLRGVSYSKDGHGNKLVAFLNTAEITPLGERYIDDLIERFK